MRIFSVTVLAVLFAAGFNANCKNKEASSREFMMEFSKTFCYKMVDCAQEKLKDVPAAQKAQMAAYMPTREKCDASLKQELGKEDSRVVLTSEQLDTGKKCMEKVKAAACNSMQQDIAECKEFTNLMGGHHP